MLEQKAPQKDHVPITPLRSCHDTAIPQLRLLPGPCVWLGPQWCQCAVLSPLRPHSHLRGNTEARASQEPLPPQPSHSGAGWRLQRRGNSSYWQHMKPSSRHMPASCCHLPPAATCLPRQCQAMSLHLSTCHTSNNTSKL